MKIKRHFAEWLRSIADRISPETAAHRPINVIEGYEVKTYKAEQRINPEAWMYPRTETDLCDPSPLTYYYVQQAAKNMVTKDLLAALHEDIDDLIEWNEDREPIPMGADIVIGSLTVAVKKHSDNKQ